MAKGVKHYKTEVKMPERYTVKLTKNFSILKTSKNKGESYAWLRNENNKAQKES